VPRGQSSDAAARLLDAAEALFGEMDPAQVSTRQITAAAGCNTGAINYHFGSKDGLLDAVLERRLSHLATERARRITQLEARAAPADLAELVDVVAAPLVALVADDPEQGPRWVRLIARLWLTRRTLVTRRVEQTFDARVLAGLARRAMADVDAETASLRWELAIDLLLMTLGDPFESLGDIDFPTRAAAATDAAVAILRSPSG
jgi:AcrR family transcriptional regulator